MKKTAHQRSTAKGHAAMAMAKRIFDARGAILETAPNVVRWIPGKGPGGKPDFTKRIPISTRHDFFTVWDAIVVEGETPSRATYFVQVTEITNMSHRRKKILESGFPCQLNDLLMGYRGRGVFRVLHGPRFLSEGEEEWKAPKPVTTRSAIRQPDVEVVEEDPEW